MATLDANELINASLGKKLTQARETLGLSIEQVAKSTRIRADKLRYLEDDDFTHFSHPSYLRLYLMDYARFLGVPFQEIRDWLPDAGRPGSENYEYIAGLGSDEAGQVRKEYFYPRGNQPSAWTRWLRIGLAVAVIGLLFSAYTLVMDLVRIGVAAGPVAPSEPTEAVAPVPESVPEPPRAVEVPAESPVIKDAELLLNQQEPAPVEERVELPPTPPTATEIPVTAIEPPANLSVSSPAAPAPVGVQVQ